MRRNTKRQGRPKPQYRKGGKRSGNKISVGPRVTADRIRVQLPFHYAAILNAAGASTAVKTLTPNAAYDVDPALGSTNTSGFAEYSTLYSKYRVVGYHYRVEVTCRETDAVHVVVVNGNGTPGTTYTNLLVACAQPFCHRATLSQYTGGMNQKTFRGFVPMRRLIGDREALSCAEFASLSSTGPTDLVYLATAIAHAAGSNLASGIYLSVTVGMVVDFFDRTTLLVSYDMNMSEIDPKIKAWKEYEKSKEIEGSSAYNRRKAIADFEKRLVFPTIKQDPYPPPTSVEIVNEEPINVRIVSTTQQQCTLHKCIHN